MYSHNQKNIISNNSISNKNKTMDLDLDSKSVVLQNMRDEIEAELLRLEERKIQERREERRMVGVGGMSSSEHNNGGTRSIRVAGSASYHHRNSSSPPSSSDLNHLSSHSLRDMNHHSSNHSLRSGYYDQQDYEHAALRPPRDYEHAALRPPRSFGSLGSLSAGSLHDSYNGSQERPPRSFGSLGSLSAGSLHDSYNGSQEHPILPRVMGQREQYSQQLHNSFGSLETLSSQGSLHHSHRDAYRYDSQQRNSTWETTKSPSRALNSNDNIFFLEYGNSPMTSETIPLSSLESSRRVLQGVPPGNVPLPLNGIDEEETMVSCGSFQSSHYRRTKSPRRGRRPNNTTLETMSCGSSHSRLVDQQAQNDNTLETMSHTSLPGKWRGSPHQYEVDGDAMSIPPSPRYFRQQQVVYHRHHGSSSQEDPNIIHSLPPQERSSMYYSSPSPGGIQSLGLHEGVEVVQSPDISIVDSHHIPGTIVLDMNNRNNQNSDLTTVANTTEQHRRRLQKLSDIRSSRQERKCNEADDELICKYAPPLPELKKGELQISSKIWTSLSFLCTFPISDKFVPKEGVEAKQAWREKAAVCFIFLLVSSIFIGVFCIGPTLLCTSKTDSYDIENVAELGKDKLISVFGTVYDISKYIDRHPGGSNIMSYLGKDVSRIFPRLPASELPEYCIDRSKNMSLFEDVRCSQMSAEDYIRGVPCHNSSDAVGVQRFKKKFEKYEEGKLVIPQWKLMKKGMPDGTMFIVLGDSVYNVTQYVDLMRDPETLLFDSNEISDHENAFLNKVLHDLIFHKLNEDASVIFREMLFADELKECMDELFFIGEVDQRNSEICMKSTYVNYTFLLLVGVLILTQVLCSVLYITRRVPEVEQEDMQAGVLVMVPCYNESEKELGKTIESVLLNDYPEDNKILMVIADGVITGRGEEMSCPETIGKILGFDFDPMDEAFHYKSIGKKTDNYASVYAGNYEKLGKKLKYVVIIKQGTPEERGTGRAGNRGKRDSQLLLFGILNRLQYHREPRAFDRKLTETFQGSGLPLHEIEYLMAIDADTRVSDNAIKSLIYNMEKNKKILACCGETRVDNKTQSWVTMMQVYEYYSAHHTKKAFESIFGCVTCLPGCFTLYRMYTEELEPLLVNDTIFQGYSRNDVSSLHERNLFELGEDRMLTTLLLQTFSGMNLSFVPEATCWTIVPHTFAILVSQRRRWINSTLHNMLELLKVKTMCGVCLCSMKTVVVFDLISTFVLPSGLIYLYYLIISSILNPSHIDPFVIFGLCSYGLMTVCFILRQEYEFFWWFTVYMIAGLPVFYFYLPIYSFLNMDDLSWGKTREIKAKPETAKKTIPSGSLDFSEKDIPEANYAKNTNRKEIKMNQNKKTSDRSLRSSSGNPRKIKRNKKKESDDSIPSPALLKISADTDANSSLCSKITQENFSASNSDEESKGKKTSDRSLRSSSPRKVKRNKKKEYDDSIPSPPLLEVSADTDANSSLCSKITQENFSANNSVDERKGKKTSDRSLRSSSRTPRKVKRNKKKESDDSIPSPPLLEVSADTDANSSLCSKITQENFSANNSDGQSKGHIQNLERVHEENSAITEDLAKVIEREAHKKGPMTTARCDPPGKRKVKKKRKAKAAVNDKPESKEKKYQAAELEWEVTLQRLSQKMEGCWPEGFASPTKEDP